MNQNYSIAWLKNKYEKEDVLKFIYFLGHTKKYGQDIGSFCFSQWFESSFVVNGVTYKTSEHWMMAQKALLFGDNNTFKKIVDCNKPGEAKALGRQVANFNENIWLESRFEIVCIGNIHKFNQNQDLGEYLLKTGNRILVEASPVDTVWGIGMSKDNRKIGNIHSWKGLNLLGFSLMEVRDFLYNFGFFSNLDNDLTAPWIECPDIDREDIFWKTSKGENIIFKFLRAYNNMTHKEKVIYKLSNPIPYYWKDFLN